MRIITFGCSHTAGEGLSDYKDDHSPELCWPQQLARILDVECVNLGRGGSSNKAIWHTAMNSIDTIQKDDVVVVLWSHLNRWHIYHHPNTRGIEILPVYFDNKNSLSRMYFEHFFSHYDTVCDLMLRSDHLHHRMPCKTLQFSVDGLTADQKDMVKWSEGHIDISASFRNDFNLDTSPDGHQGPKSHMKFAEFVAGQIQ